MAPWPTKMKLAEDCFRTQRRGGDIVIVGLGQFSVHHRQTLTTPFFNRLTLQT